MKRTIAVALAALFAVATSAHAGFYCKLQDNFCDGEDSHKAECSVRTGNSYANSHVLEWHWGQAFPSTSKFHYESKDVSCFVDGGILYNVLPYIRGFSSVTTLESGTTQTTGSGPKVGIVYRGDQARFLIDNLRSIPYDKQGVPNGGNPGVYLDDWAFGFKP